MRVTVRHVAHAAVRISNRRCRSYSSEERIASIAERSHQGVSYLEQGQETNPAARKRRVQKMTMAFRKLGYAVALTPIQVPERE